MNGVYRLKRDPRFKWFMLPKKEGRRWSAILSMEDGTIQDWPQLKLEAPLQDNPKRTCDYPSITLGAIPLFSSRAKSALGDLLSPCVQFLPVQFSEQTYFLGKILKQTDCLDVERSDIEWFDGEEMVNAVEINRPVFSVPTETLPPLFYIKYFRGAELFCTEELKFMVEAKKLSGFVFKPFPREQS